MTRSTRWTTRRALLVATLGFALLFPGCGDSDSDPTPDGDLDAPSESAGEEDSNGEIDADATEGDLDGEETAEGEESPFDNPSDDRLYVGAGARVITPDETNHPCPLYMGGTGSGRLATATHDDLEMRALALARNGERVLMVSMDLVGVTQGDLLPIRDALSAWGLTRDRVILASTHSHTAPDTLGLYGPTTEESGRCPAYMDFLRATVLDLAAETIGRIEPVTAAADRTTVHEPGANYPNLVNDLRPPRVTNDALTAVRFIGEDHQTVAVLVNWHSHPETMIPLDIYSADFPHYLRRTVEAELGGTCVFFSGTVGGLQTPIGVGVPQRTESGEPVLEGGEPVYVEEDDEIKNWSLGYILADYVLALLAGAPALDPTLSVDTEEVRLPVENPVFMLAFDNGLVAPPLEIVQNDDDCKGFGCLSYSIIEIRIGRLHIVTLPGELFPEISVGREAQSVDWEGEWGVKEYEAITGYQSALPEGDLLMEFGLANNEIGYILPKGDYLPSGHPNNYEEYFSLSKKTAEILRLGMIRVLER